MEKEEIDIKVGVDVTATKKKNKRISVMMKKELIFKLDHVTRMRMMRMMREERGEGDDAESWIVDQFEWRNNKNRTERID